MQRERTYLAAVALVAAALFGFYRADSPDSLSTGLPQEPLAAVPADWSNAVQQSLAEAEYHITQADGPSAAGLAGAYQAPNRAQDFRTYFTELGIQVIPRTAHRDEAPSWTWGLTLSDWGRNRMPPTGGDTSPQRQVNGNRIEYRRRGLIEWYVNDARGLEQGFTITSPPEGDMGRAKEPVRLHLEVSGTLRGMLADDRQALDFATEEGARPIRFDHLHVEDARGRILPAWFELADAPAEGEMLAIVVDDRHADYPVTIDPLATSPSWTAESDQAFATLGWAAATAGDVNGDGFSDVIVGAHQFDNGLADEGRTFVYHGSAGGLSITPAWTAEGNQLIAFFGESVGTAGDVNNDGFSDVIVGARLFNNGQGDEGRAFVYHGSPGGLSPTPAWTAESNQANAQFGVSVAPAGDLNGDGFGDVIVGAYLFDNGQIDEGRAFVYHGSAVGLSATPAWTAESDQADAFFGASVATAGDINGDGFSDVVIGAYQFDNGQSNEGRTYSYPGSASGLSAVAGWTAEGDQADSQFGYSVATAGDVNGDGFSDVIVGARYFDNGQLDEGRAHVYHGSASGLSLAFSWTAESDQAVATFGFSVGTAGDVNGDGFADVIVGARQFDNGQTDEGRALVFYGSAAGVGTIPAWTVEGDQASANLGTSVATAGDVNGDGFSEVIVGAPQYGNGEMFEGRTFVYGGSAAGLSNAAGWTVGDDQADALFGWSVATAGDVNGDGFGDVIIGAHAFDNGQVDEGRTFVYLGSMSGLGATPAWSAESDQASAHFGLSAGAAGDVNGDGFGDVIVGARQFDNGQTDEGRAFVYHGSEGGLSATPAWTAESGQASAFFGLSVGTAGDVNGDGFADVIIGAYLFDNGQTDEGRTFVYHGSEAGVSALPAWTAEIDQSNAYFGYSAATAGDVDGDGFSDVIVGAYQFDNGQADEGRAYAYHGSMSGLSATPTWTAESDQVAASFGRSVASAGDVNGDGFSDVIIGARQFDNGQLDEGRAAVYHGSASGLNVTSAWTAESDNPGALFGLAVNSAGDVNGDGFCDVVLAAPFFDNGQVDEGRAFVYHGSASGITPAPSWMAESDEPSAYFGVAVASAGDVNGDGFSDVIVGSSHYLSGSIHVGRASVYHGNEGLARGAWPRQQHTDGVTPVAALGRSDSETQFRIRAVMLSVFGRTYLQMEREVKPLGQLFDGLDTVADDFSDAVSDGEVEANSLVSGLTAGTPYHWRVRARYDLVRTPFQGHGPWIQVPNGGWNEADLRTADQASMSTNPSATGFATPGTLPAGGSTLLQVSVTPGTNPASTSLSVAVNLSSIGGSTQHFLFDDGTNGDVTAGDNIFSWNAPVIRSATPGMTSLPVTVADGEARSGLTTIPLTVDPAPSLTTTVHTEFWITENLARVIAIASQGNTIYIGGTFSYLGPHTGSGVPLHAGTGAAASVFPKVDGRVSTVIPDGAGGWYIGGLFSRVGGSPRLNIARILADGSVSPWNPSASGEVRVLVPSGSTIYAGGSFRSIGGQLRNRIAALDAATGVATAWNPNANNTVITLAVSGSTVYAGGGFTNIGGQTRNRIGAIDATTGTVTSFNGNASSTVYALAVGGSTLYAGGAFATIGGQSRRCIAALDPATGTASSWNPDANGGPSPHVLAIAVSGTTVYAGGMFNEVGGEDRNGLAALDATTGAATGWNPSSLVGRQILDIQVSGSVVYVGGRFSGISDEFRRNIGAIDINTGLATAWSSLAGDGVIALAVAGSTVYAGGEFHSLGGVTRNSIAALDATTGVPTAWNPDASGSLGSNSVLALAVSGSTIYAGGDFDEIGGQTRSRIAALDGTTGAATGWNPGADFSVTSIVPDGPTVYAGGEFTMIGGQPRNRIAALDASTGAATAWNPNADNTVLQLMVSGSTVYAGGLFTSLGGVSRVHAGALSTSTGTPTAWNPEPDLHVASLAVAGSIVYAGGYFTGIGGQVRNGIAALDAATGVATAWDPDANDAVNALVIHGSTVFVGGLFGSIGGQARNRLAALDLSTGAATAWDANADGVVQSLAAVDSTLYVGGQFTTISEETRHGFAALSVPYVPSTSSVPEVPPVGLRLASLVNPVRSSMALRFALPTAARVDLQLFDASGRLVGTLVNDQPMPAGWHEATLPGGKLRSGVYFARLTAGRHRVSEKLVVISNR